jgi:F0F1-type ATP synthase delta subunit
MTLSRTLAQTIIKKNIQVKDIEEVLRAYKLVALLPCIVEQLKRLNTRNQEGETICIESPFPLAEDSIVKIKHSVGSTTAKHEIRISEKLLAGFKARYHGKLYDGSVERIIRELTIH